MDYNKTNNWVSWEKLKRRGLDKVEWKKTVKQTEWKILYHLLAFSLEYYFMPGSSVS